MSPAITGHRSVRSCTSPTPTWSIPAQALDCHHRTPGHPSGNRRDTATGIWYLQDRVIVAEFISCSSAPRSTATATDPDRRRLADPSATVRPDHEATMSFGGRQLQHQAGPRWPIDADVNLTTQHAENPSHSSQSGPRFTQRSRSPHQAATICTSVASSIATQPAVGPPSV